MSDQAKLKKRLEDMLKLPENQICADCRSRGPRWASANLGVFVCLNCSGIHRNLGVHISFVRSVNLDSWQKEQVDMMEQWGNKRAAMYYEACVPSDYRRPREHASVREMERWIRDKYEHKRFIPADGSIPEPSEPTPEPQPSVQEPSRTPRQSAKTRPVSAVPSPTAARAQIPAPAPAPAPAPVVETSLIDFSEPDPVPVLPPSPQINAFPTQVPSPAAQVPEPAPVPPPAPAVDNSKLSTDAILSMYTPQQMPYMASNGVPNGFGQAQAYPLQQPQQAPQYQYQYQYGMSMGTGIAQPPMGIQGTGAVAYGAPMAGPMTMPTNPMMGVPMSMSGPMMSSMSPGPSMTCSPPMGYGQGYGQPMTPGSSMNTGMPMGMTNGMQPYGPGMVPVSQGGMVMGMGPGMGMGMTGYPTGTAPQPQPQPRYY